MFSSIISQITCLSFFFFFIFSIVQLYITNSVASYVQDFYIETLVNDEPHGKFIDPFTTASSAVSLSTVGKKFQLHTVPKRNHVDTIPKTTNTEKQKTNYRQMSATYYDGLSSSVWANDQVGHGKRENRRSNSDDDYDNKWSAKTSELVTMANGRMGVGSENSNWRNNNGDNEVYSDTNDGDDVDVDEDDADDEDDDNSNCNANIWSEKLTPHSRNRTMNWILSETHSKDKTVKFRYVCFIFFFR